jgi:energy-coupling factor transport system ATP-binding protein
MKDLAQSTLQLQNVSFAYHPGVAVLQDVSLGVVPGEFLGLVGPNGSGKTTLAKLLNGTLLPSSGTVRVGGLSTLLAQNFFEIKRLVTLIHSDPENQLLTPTVFDEITFSLRALDLGEAEIISRSQEALETFDLQQYRDTHPYFLSVGEQFRLLVAAGLARQPRVIVLDEVYSMLDSQMRSSITRMLLDLRTKYNLSIILITHRLEDLMCADRILVLVRGQIVAEGNLDTLFAHPNMYQDWMIEKPLLYQVSSNPPPDFGQELTSPDI